MRVNEICVLSLSVKDNSMMRGLFFPLAKVLIGLINKVLTELIVELM